MLLTIDIGNTNMVFGIYKGEEMLGSFRLSTSSTATSDEIGILAVSYFERFGYRTEDLKACIIGSVVPQVCILSPVPSSSILVWSLWWSVPMWIPV